MFRIKNCCWSAQWGWPVKSNLVNAVCLSSSTKPAALRSVFVESGRRCAVFNSSSLVLSQKICCNIARGSPRQTSFFTLLSSLNASHLPTVTLCSKYLQHMKTAWHRGLRYHRTLKSQSHSGQSSLAVVYPMSVAVVTMCWWWHKGNGTAHCKAMTGQNRLVGHGKEEGENELKFSWEKLWTMLWEDIVHLLLAVLSAIGAATVSIQIPIMLGEVTNVVTKFTADTAGNFLEEMKKPALKLIGLYILQGLLTFSYITLLSTVGENLAVRLRQELFHAYLKQDIAFFDSYKTGELMDRLTSDIQDFKSSFKLCVSQGLKATTQTIGCATSLILISPKLSALMLTVIPAIIGSGTVLGHVLRKFSKESQEQIAKSAAVADEAIGNIRTVRAFAMESKENELYSEQLALSRHLNIKLGVGIGAFQGLANIFLNGIVLGSMFAGGWLISLGELKAGDLMSFLVATQMIERSLAQMSVLFGTVVRGISAGARVFEFIDAEPLVQLTGGQTIPYHSMVGSIQFKDVAFSYPTRPGQVVLHDFNLDIPGGSFVALVGLSGGGKTTVAFLLERFYDVTHGAITIDGIDIRHLDPSWLRGRAIGFISQEPVLFATSVMENIRYGRPEATDEEVMEAAKLANAHTFISGFPQGYNTVLGERGVTVSGGQKQRIAIARALIKNPSILILDEATSALDAESERLVQEALDHVTKGRTVLVIAHRLSTIRNADIIAVVSHGKIVEIGDHNSLKKKRSLYWDLMKKQEIEEELEST